MDRRVAHPASLFAVALVTLAVAAFAPPVVRGALPPRHGGALTLPAPEPLRTLDPARVDTHFEATLAHAVFDGLYELRPDGSVEAVLADGPPEVQGAVARIRIREGARLQWSSRDLRARHVVRSLLRVASSQSSWLLGAFATENGRPAVREVDPSTVEIGLARRGVRVDLVLAASSLAIVAGGNLRRRPLGTGPFRARLDGRGGVELGIFRPAVDRAPWMNRIVFHPPRSREDEVRAFELGRVDASWRGRSLYGGEPVRPVATTSATLGTPVLLVPNRARALRDDAAWGGVVASIDRRRLERAGLEPRRSLSAGLPAPELPRGRARRGETLRMPVPADRILLVRAAEAIAGMLDERGVHLTVERLSRDRYEQAIARSQWDLRLAVVRPPLPGRGPMAGAALAAAGQLDRARQLAPRLGDAEVAARTARALDAMVLGNERVVLHHRADLRGMRFDGFGRIPLADLSFARRQEPFR